MHLAKGAGGVVSLDAPFFDWFEQDAFTESLPELLKSVKHIYMAGGEPLKTKAHTDFLKKIIELGFHKKMTLEYNTNGYVIPEGLWELWKQFELVKIGLSIDSVSKMNDYIRYPSKWSILSDNITRFDQTDGKFIVWLCLTVHCYNIFYLPEMITWRVKSNFKKINNSLDNLVFSDHPLHNPQHLNVQILPVAAKQAVMKKFTEFKKAVPELIKENAFMTAQPEASVERIYSFLDSYVNFMNKSHIPEAFPKFMDYTQKLDRVRDETFAGIFPEWEQILSNE